MARYLIRRFAVLVVSLLLAMAVIFALLRLLPGDPVHALLSVNATPQQIAAAQAQVGSGRPLADQFVSWFGNMLTLNLGQSFVSSLPVGPEIISRLAVTIPLTLIAFVLALVLSFVIGFVSAWKADRWYGAALSAFSQLGIAVPVFWLGILLVDIFAIHLRVLPAGGFPPDKWASVGDAFTSLILPVISIAIVMSAALARYVRSATLGVLDSDYLRTARALGSPFLRAVWRHGIRNGAVPVIAVLGIELATTFLGAVVVEVVFALPGLGSMLVVSIQQHDYPNMQGVLLAATFIVLLVGFAADVVQRLVDPRLRQSISRSR